MEIVKQIKSYASGGGRTRDNIINDLIKDNKPVVIFGAGKFAKAAAELLLKHNMVIKCFVDEEQYFFDGKTVCINENTFPCILLKDLKDNPLTFNIVSGNIDYGRINILKNLFKNCSYIEYLDGYTPHIIDENFIEKNLSILQTIYENLSDDESKKVMKGYLYARFTGDVSKLSELKSENGTYDWTLLKINQSDIFVDGGAYTGDTVKDIQQTIGYLPKEIFEFEPDDGNLVKLLKNFTPDEIRKIRPIPAGLYSDDKILKFNSAGCMGSAISDDGKFSIKTFALDNYQAFNNVSVIKMDIEGSEVEAIKGAENIIRKNKPRCAVCIYHKNSDIIDVYNLLKKYNPAYKFYLRQHGCSVEETVLYAI